MTETLEIMKSHTTVTPHWFTSCCLIAAMAVIANPGCGRAPDSDSGRAQENGREAGKSVLTDSGSEGESSSVTNRYSNWQPEFDAMCEVLQPGEQEREQLQAVFEKHSAKLQKWSDENRSTMRQIKSDALDAFRRKDKRKMDRMNARGDKDTIAKLTNQERQMLSDYRRELIDVLPAGKQDLWRSHVIAEHLLQFVEPMTLNTDQQQQIRELAPRAIRSLSREQLRENWSGYGTAKLETLFERTVLPRERADEFEALKNRNKMRMLKWGSSTLTF